MSSINIGEEDFRVVANAAQDAKNRGDMAEALKLDKIAHKMNASLGNQSARKLAGEWARGAKGLTWRDVESTLI